MKKIGIINQPIAAVMAGLGHTDTIVIADAGLPIPAQPQRIDLALTQGIPTFLDTLRVILTEMQLERAIVAAEFVPGRQSAVGRPAAGDDSSRNLQTTNSFRPGGHPDG